MNTFCNQSVYLVFVLSSNNIKNSLLGTQIYKDFYGRRHYHRQLVGISIRGHVAVMFVFELKLQDLTKVSQKLFIDLLKLNFIFYIQ